MRSAPGFRSLKSCVFVLVLLLMPALASAQSAITGLVRDTSGAVLPGVTVEAASPVLIEKARAAVTDEQGRFTIVDLRPGTYTVTVALAGFNTFKTEGLELPANFTATVNAELRVGAIEESVTVTSAAPVVDVQSTQRTQVLNRDMLDAVPTARNYSGLAALMPGVRQSASDVGGSQQMEQIYMTSHGSRQTDTTVQVDGMMLNSLMNNGQVQSYFSDAANAEVSFQTSGVGADVSTGGVRINMIPKEGGNRISGSAFIGGTNGSWQSNNIDDELRSRNLLSGDRVNRITDFNFAVGGPIMRDRLWFFTTWRRIATDEVVADNFYANGDPGIEDQWVQNQLVRLTWQVNQKNKISAYNDRYPKFKGHEMGARTDPATASQRRDPEHALYYTGQIKWTSTITPRLLLESGYSTNIENLLISNQPGIKKERGTPEWYTTVRHNDIILGTNTVSGSAENGIYPARHVFSSIASYVTGSHSLRTGVQWSFGDYRTSYDINADLVQQYQNGVPSVVTVYNTPVYGKERLNADMGIFAQDSWTLKRMTIGAGVRFDYLNAEIQEQGVGAGRFAPAREFAKVPDMPNWFNVAPRLGIAYDLFGNARTALKGSVNKYMAGQTTGFPARYNPLALQTEQRSWTDTNGDDIAQDSEIGPSQNARFGQAVTTVRPGDDLQREYDWVYNAGVQHQLMPGLAMNANWFRRGTYNLRRTDNQLVGLGDYTPVAVVNPLDGEVFTLYNLNPNKFQQVDEVDVNSTDSDLRRRTYTGYEFGFNGRVGPASFFGGWTSYRTINVECDNVSDPNTFRFCDQRELDMPWRNDLKVAGSYMLPLKIQLNAAIQSYAGNELRVDWQITRTTRYAANCPGPCRPGELVIPNLTRAALDIPQGSNLAAWNAANISPRLIAPGTKYLTRHNQVDLGVRKVFQVGRYQFSAQADVFNATNSNRVNGETQTFGANLGRPTSILQPRMLRLAGQMRF
jgi:hypothetical protein